MPPMPWSVEYDCVLPHPLETRIHRRLGEASDDTAALPTTNIVCAHPSTKPFFSLGSTLHLSSLPNCTIETQFAAVSVCDRYMALSLPLRLLFL